MVCFQRRERVRIKVRGNLYETTLTTLEKFPDTLLGDRKRRCMFFDARTNEYRFDCGTDVFDAVLFYYQSNGILSQPLLSSKEDYDETIRFFGLAEKPAVKKDSVDVLQKYAEKMWLLKKIDNANARKAYFFLSFAFIIASIAFPCMETVLTKDRPKIYTASSVWFVSESCFIGAFSLEYVLRNCLSLQSYYKSFLGLVDLISLIPFYVTVLLMTSPSICTENLVWVLRTLAFARTLKLVRYNSGFEIFGKTLISCAEHLLYLLTPFIILIVFSAALVYVFESFDERSMFDSILDTVYFVVVTVTTVGYGDYYPVTFLGKCSTAVAILFGAVLLFQMFLPTYLMKFSYYYLESKIEAQREENERQRFPNVYRSNNTL